MAWVVLGMYGLFLLVSVLNLVLMRKPRSREDGPGFCVLIPARDEEANLRELIPLLMQQRGPKVKVYVFDDESSDNTAETAAALGAAVIRAREPLPVGWAGKNRACHELAKVAMEDSDAEWYLFLDADTRPGPGFLNSMRSLAAQVGRRAPVLTGFPQIRPGRGPEPLFLGWVGWSLLALNPFGLVCRTGMGHNRFTNGQMHAWRADVYAELWPNEAVKGNLLEDVMMGRLLAQRGYRVETANFSGVIAVRMYESWRETLDGMSKNSYEITGSAWGSVLLALFFSFAAWGWVLAGSSWWVCLLFLSLSGVAVCLLVRTVMWPALLMPVSLSIGAFTVLRSLAQHRRGGRTWKGRTY